MFLDEDFLTSEMTNEDEDEITPVIVYDEVQLTSGSVIIELYDTVVGNNIEVVYEIPVPLVDQCMAMDSLMSRQLLREKHPPVTSTTPVEETPVENQVITVDSMSVSASTLPVADTDESADTKCTEREAPASTSPEEEQTPVETVCL